MQEIMQEIGRFFGNLFSGIINRLTYDATNAVEQKVRNTVNQQLEERQKPKPQDLEERQKPKPQDLEDHN